MQTDIIMKTNKRQRIHMAATGENIEALIEQNEPEVLCELIKNGYAKEYYEAWKTQLGLK